MPTADVPPAAVREPADTHGEDFAVLARDVEDVRVAVIEQESLLSFRLGLDEARDVFQGREMALRQFPADVPVVSVLLEEGRDVGTFGSRRNELAVFDVEPFAERIPDIEPGTVLVELGGVERLGPGRSVHHGDGPEEPRFADDGVALRNAPERVDRRLFDVGLELVASLDSELSGVLVEFRHYLFQSGLHRARDEVLEELLQLPVLVFRDRLGRHRTLLFSR